MDNTSLRFLFDLQATQTPGSKNRGVGRYSDSLFKAFFSEEPSANIYALISQDLPSPNLAFINQARILRLPTLPHWDTERDFLGGNQDSLDAIAYSSLAQTIKPDVTHISHACEDFQDRIPLPNLQLKSPGQVISATLYDLIPLRFQEHYFQNDEFKRWYLARMAWLRQADLLLAISDSTREDAIELLGLDPTRIVTIHGGVDAHFKPLDDTVNLKENLKKHYPLTERMVLYTGGDEYRKNLSGAIQGFAKTSPDIRQNTSLFIVCSISESHKKTYLKEALAAGLAKNNIHFTGFISEEDLVAFYNVCDVFIFPSKYEGFGLPVLEAMSCGAAVIGSNNSSIREIIHREDALFDADSPESIADMLNKVLTDDEFRNALKFYGIEHAKRYSWEKTAELARTAFKEALSLKQQAGVQAALHGWLPKRRLAMLTPLPPCRSGIADYNAQFLPYLAKHFEIDLYVDGYTVTDVNLTSAFHIYHVKDFEKVATSYDAILYEMGNSEYHAHMIPLLMRFPGVVGLHDAFLSGLMSHMDFNLGTHHYIHDTLEAHGSCARQYFAPLYKTDDSIYHSTINLPCSKSIINHAIGIISHTRFNLETAKNHYPEGWLAPYHTIPQMALTQKKPLEDQRLLIKAGLGFGPDAFIITSFGHVAWTKCGDQIIDAFLASKLFKESDVYLVFAGELSPDSFGEKLKHLIHLSKSGNRIHITGYLSNEDYIKYLSITDIGIQLRQSHRGGTPKGVMDCLAYKIPVMVNNDGSYTDYPDDVVIKLNPKPETTDIKNTLEYFYTNRDAASQYALNGFSYVSRNHHPTICAASYASSINDFIERQKTHLFDYWIKAFAPYLGNCNQPLAAEKAAQTWLNHLSAPNIHKTRLFIDVSHIAQNDHNTGIPRVVKEIIKSLYCIDKPGFEPLAVELIEGELYPAKDWLCKQELLLFHEAVTTKGAAIKFRPGDQLLMLDSSWERYREFFPIFEQARQSFVSITTVIYDLLPILLPKHCVVEGGKEWFEQWLSCAITQSDKLLCISQTAANDVIHYIQSQNIHKPNLKIDFWHLGADFNAQKIMSDNSPQKLTLPKPYLLMVGTVEPRKSHDIALDLMEQLWQEGLELNLYIAGKEGWLVDETMKRIKSHPFLNKNLFFNDSLDDTQINHLYANAAGLLFLSKGEGFGLPLVEAANHGIPILCTDLLVFKEIAGDYATYLDINNKEILLKQIKNWWENHHAGKLPDTKNMPRLSWKQSAEKLLNLMLKPTSWYWEKKSESLHSN
jgi:glycosyltransferase involved in cell wall biosynthesis